MRICDLPIKIENTDLDKSIHILYDELDKKHIQFHPSCYLADEWFSPEDEPIIGIPFYLAHPRLIKLEETMMLDAEGAHHDTGMRLLRHETGHAITHAYHLHRKKGWKKAFGQPSKDYSPETARPHPYSKSFVTNLEKGYAQSHPDEDFAETFAVWLNPDSNWRKQYRGWGAFKKLEYVERLMKQISRHPPLVTKGKKMCEASRLRKKLKDYYQNKRNFYQEDFPDFFDADLKRIFSDNNSHASKEKASRFIERHKKILLNTLFAWTRAKKYTINGLLKKLIARCDYLNLQVNRTDSEAILQIGTYLTTLASNYIHTGKFKRTR